MAKRLFEARVWRTRFDGSRWAEDYTFYGDFSYSREKSLHSDIATGKWAVNDGYVHVNIVGRGFANVFGPRGHADIQAAYERYVAKEVLS